MNVRITERRSVIISAAVTTALVALAGCGLPGLEGDSGPRVKPTRSTFSAKAPAPSGKPLGPDAKVPKPPEVDGENPTEVVKAWARVAYSYDTKYDASPQDAVLRAARYFTEKKAEQEREYRRAAGADARWNEWAEHKAWMKVETQFIFDGDAPPDRPLKAHRQLTVEGKAIGRDDWKGQGPRVQAFVTLKRGEKGKPWRISELHLIPAAAVPSTQAGDTDESSESP
ncbi:hypothetical protein [Streptomyces oceani]|uniref:hypothetical protein n=1 Tax=Streptomyces oceani TaxID=1075402 RepID=UPI001112DCB3|nr:hypothetical protein [Streptomyces oceani]